MLRMTTRTRTRLASLVSVASVAASSLFASAASARPNVLVTHVLGPGATWVAGWNEAIVTLDNKDLPAWRGEVLVDPTYDHRSIEHPSVRVPVTLAAGESARVVLPFYLRGGSFPTVFLAEQGKSVGGEVALTQANPLDLVHEVVEVQGNLARGEHLMTLPTPGGGAPGTPGPTFEGEIPGAPTTSKTSAYSSPSRVTTVQFARETGDPILPDLGVGWSGAELVVIPSDILSRLTGRQHDALEAWVLSGGTLAVSVVREEDLRSKNLQEYVGEARSLGIDSGKQTFTGTSLTKASLAGGSDEGEVAHYGLGDVWLLRRDPWARTPDPLAGKDIYTLSARARERRRELISLPFGRGVPWVDDDTVRSFIDPNHAFRPPIGIAAVLVVLYAFLVGPVLFARARKSGKPLAVLRFAPLLALALFGVLIGLGKIGKGLRGRVRKLEMMDVAGGAQRGPVTAFHAFYVGDPAQVELTASRPESAVHLVDPFQDSVPIDLDRDAIAVRSVRTHPWQTVVIEEETTRDLDGGTLVLEGSGNRLSLTNKTPWTLEHVVLHPDSVIAPSRYFRTVAPGATIVARDGVEVERRLFIQGKSEVIKLGDTVGDRSKSIFGAVETLARATFMFGGGTPLPLAEPFATGIVHLAAKPEAGIAVDDDVLFVRVVGLGGGKGKGEIDNPLEKKGKEEEL